MKQSTTYMLLGAVYLSPHLWPGVAVFVAVCCVLPACMAATKKRHE